jgi:hypothetical protein
MNTVAKAANGLWSVICLLVAMVLVGLFVYWTVIQKPFVFVDQNAPMPEYRVTAGSLLYIDNPVIPTEVVARVSYSGMLVKDGDQYTKYALASPEMASREEIEGADTVVRPTKPAASLYAVFIPSYVQPGTYTYKITATYKLNPFRSENIPLPDLTIKVE